VLPRDFIDLPNDLVNCVPATDPGWLTQPRATVLAACIALVAAAIAWASTRAQIRAEDRRARRTERLDALTEATAAAHDLALSWGTLMEGPSAESRESYSSAFVRTLLARGKLEILGGYRTVIEALEDVIDEATQASKRPGPPDGAELGRRLGAVSTAITKVVSPPRLRVVRRSKSAGAPAHGRVEKASDGAS